jgi:hypothetical protein
MPELAVQPNYDWQEFYAVVYRYVLRPQLANERKIERHALGNDER